MHFTQNLSHSQISLFQASENNRGNDLKFAKIMENQTVFEEYMSYVFRCLRVKQQITRDITLTILLMNRLAIYSK